MYVQVRIVTLLALNKRMSEARYRQIYSDLKSGIQQGTYAVDDYLPSEHTLCRTYSITRTTARKALDELLKEGFIEKEHGKGSKVKERRQTLGLLTVKGFSEAVGENVETQILRAPKAVPWLENFPFQISKAELGSPCIFFERIRGVKKNPVMLEQNWFSGKYVKDLVGSSFVEDSFFKTLSRNYQIEITASEQELRAQSADDRIARLLKMEAGDALLKIAVKFSTSIPDMNIYSYLYCNTEKYPIGNKYIH